MSACFPVAILTACLAIQSKHATLKACALSSERPSCSHDGARFGRCVTELCPLQLQSRFHSSFNNKFFIDPVGVSCWRRQQLLDTDWLFIVQFEYGMVILWHYWAVPLCYGPVLGTWKATRHAFSRSSSCRTFALGSLALDVDGVAVPSSWSSTWSLLVAVCAPCVLTRSATTYFWHLASACFLCSNADGMFAI